MHTKISTRLFAASLMFCLVMFSGCKMFSGHPVDEPVGGVSPNDSPSQKHQPRTLAELTGQPPAAKQVLEPQTPETESGDKSKISLDDVSLEPSEVHVDAGVDIEDLEQDAQEQLPKIVESAVHPFSEISEPFTLSDQSADQTASQQQPPMHPVQTAQQTPPPQTPQQTPDPSSPRSQPESIEDTDLPPVVAASSLAPVQSAPTESLGDVRQEQSRSAAESSPQVMRIVAESDGQRVRSADRIAAATDRLFDATGPNPGNVSIVKEQPPQTAESSRPVQPIEKVAETVQPVSHQEIQTPTVPLNQANTSANKIADSSPPLTTAGQAKQLDWRQQLSTAIQRMDQEASEAEQGASLNQQIRLQLLRIAAGEVSPDKLVLNGDDENINGYWRHQLAAIGEMLDENETAATTQAAAVAARRRRVTRASESLEMAHSQLTDISTLRLAQCVFASEVRGFGQFTTLPSVFNVGQQVLIYCEIENYSLRESRADGKTQQVAELQGQFTIVDASNRIVYQHQYQPVKDAAQRRRKDFYMFFPVTVPNLPTGQYRLQLSVEDLVGNKVASYSEDMIFNISGLARRQPQPRVAAAPPPVETAPPVQNISPPVQNPAAPARAAPPANATSGPPPVVTPRDNRNAPPAANNQPLPMNRYQQPMPNARIPLPTQGNQPLPISAANYPNQPLPMNQSRPTNQMQNNNEAPVTDQASQRQ